jgi:hypothetical protein
MRQNGKLKKEIKNDLNKIIPAQKPVDKSPKPESKKEINFDSSSIDL